MVLEFSDKSNFRSDLGKIFFFIAFLNPFLNYLLIKDFYNVIKILAISLLL